MRTILKQRNGGVMNNAICAKKQPKTAQFVPKTP
jgi:hypothetical protein